nr:FAD-dependent oxidoreductase [Micromonospora sp. DSM 115978]
MSEAGTMTGAGGSGRRPAAEHVVIVGAGAAGMFAALLLARGGARVTLLDSDPAPLPTTLAEVATWPRPGIPQAGHSHAFLARFRQLLVEHLPDLLDGLLAAGAREIRLPAEAPATLLGAAPDDPDLVVVG